MSDEWFAFHGPPKVADSLPDNKIVQGLSNFNSFHWLTTIKTTPQDTEMEQKSRHGFATGSFLHGMCSHSSIHSVPGQGEQLQDLRPHPSCPQITGSTGITCRKSILCVGLLLHPAAGKHSAQSDAWRLDLDSSSLEIRAVNCWAI